MKSKRFFSLILTFIIAMVLVACSSKAYSPKPLIKEGIQPYKLSKGEKYLLQSFGMEENSQIISFNAPKEAITLNVNVYILEGGKSWNSIGGVGISI